MNYGRSAVFRRKALNCAVKVILNVVERRNVHALNLCAELQKLLLGLALIAALAEQIYYLKVNLLALADEEQIHKIGNRLGVAGAGASGNYDIFKLSPVGRFNRHVSELKHIEHICKAQLVLESKADEIKVGNRVSAFEGVERNIVLHHQLLHINPRRKDALAPDIIARVEKAV